MNEAEAQGGQRFPIVGIGASAGGLGAFEAFFAAMPADTESGMAFVLVQHLAPDHKSILCELVKRYTRAAVYEVEDGVTVEPNCVYIIPPNRDLALQRGKLVLSEPGAPRGQRLPIDFFFRSLAQDLRERAICIVFSGTGSDGTLGLREIKGQGGMVMAQDPDTTEHDGMPRSAIATGLVDFVLPPGDMPAQLVAYAARVFSPSCGPKVPIPVSDDALEQIFAALRAQTGHDFSAYKLNTIVRRVERRMAVHQIDDLRGYVGHLREDPTEVPALFRDLLIGVTSFFRDPEAFAALEQLVLPRLFAGKAPGTVIRVWVAGCSTGEEAYSIAMLLQERVSALRQNFKVQIFATDIDRQAIEQARAGVYPASVAADVGDERMARFFVEEPDGSYRIRKSIRDLLIFSEQDMIKDPPFSRLDLISCRNVMIYMGPDLQKKLLLVFHYSLSPGANLFLGTSETLGELGDLFTTVDRKSRLYQRREPGRGMHAPSWGRPVPPLTGPRATSSANPRETKPPLQLLTERALLQHLALAAALVDTRGVILYIHGRTGRYLEPAPGDGPMNVLTMARDGLRRDLTIALHRTVALGVTVRQSGLRVRTNGGYSTIDLTIEPLIPGAEIPYEPTLYLVILEDARAVPERSTSTPSGAATAEPVSDRDLHITALKQELRAKEEYLQTTNEELETSNEELRSSNEEMQSVNEELQSSNEELETSKEELQSVNEELATVNAELQTKVADLSRVNNDMNNLLAGTGIGTIFVDQELRVQRFTPAVTEVIHLIPTDVGRPVAHVVTNLVGYDRLADDVTEVLTDLNPKEIEVQSRSGSWFLLRIRPYRTLEDTVEGAVVSFVDVTRIKQAPTSGS